MKHLITLAALVLLMTACVPALAPEATRTNGDVAITVTANQDVYSVSVTILDAVVDHPRCTIIDADAWCYVGDMPKGDVFSVTATGEFGVACTAAGFLDESRSVGSYRPFACRVTR